MPQPDQVTLLQRAQRAGLHMGDSSSRTTWNHHYTPGGIQLSPDPRVRYPGTYHRRVPIRSAYLARAFFIVAAVTVPWTVYLAITLPLHYTAHHYWLGWFGFDVALLTVLAVTGRALLRDDVAASRYAAVAATMLVVDAWFDVLNAATRTEQFIALAMALLVELPLAYVCWRIARRQADLGRTARPAGSLSP